MNCKISTVILNWNRPEDTINAVDSVLKQDYENTEIIIWDNASTDHSVEQLNARYSDKSKVILHAARQNFGVAEGRNRAFAMASGDILFSLDSDAWLSASDALTNINRLFQKKDNLGVLSFEVIRPDGHLMWPFSRPATAWRNRSFETHRIDGCAFAVRKEIFEQVGGFAGHFSPYGAEDLHFSLKITGLGLEIRYEPGLQVVHAFSDKGRNQHQQTMHVRNMLWISMELFPFPHNVIRFMAMGYMLFRECLEQHQPRPFLAGLLQSILHFETKHRNPLPRTAYRHFRAIIQADKKL